MDRLSATGPTGIHDHLLAHPDVKVLFTDEAHIAGMLAFEAALARAEADCGVIPAGAGDAITEAIATLTIAPASLSEPTRDDGVPVPELVRQIRAHVGGDAAQYVHWGATSQDVIDTSFMLRLRHAVDMIAGELRRTGDALAQLTEANSDTVMLGRTRAMHAVPTTFGAKTAVWLGMIARHLARYAELKPRLGAHVVSLGGAVGTRSILGEDGAAVLARMGPELGLDTAPSEGVWHTARDVLTEALGWAAHASVSLGKAGADILDLASNDVAEVSVPGGASSTMPNKVNPIAAEMLVTLARANATAVSGVLHGGLQAHERGGDGWTVEWIFAPDILVHSFTAARTAADLMAGLKPRADRMRANLDAGLGLPYAEMASFALAKVLPRPDAQAAVKAACQKAAAEGSQLRPLLEALNDDVDWDTVFADPWIAESARNPIDAALAEWAKVANAG
ncbi:MAG: lyase family protein [Pseudomonadota bacterium]